GSDTPRSDEDRLKLMELMVFVLKKTVNLHVYISCIKQFWNTTVVKRSGDVTRLQALVDKKRIVITEEVVHEILQLNDAEGVICLPNDEIFAGLARIGYEKPSTKLTFYKAFFSSQWKFFIHTILHSLSAKRTSWNEFSSAMASALICLSSGQRFNFLKYIFKSLVRNVDSSSKFYMYPRFIQLIIQLNIADLSKHTNRYISPILTQKVFANMRRVGKGFSGVETPLFETMLAVRDVAKEAEAQILAQGDDVQEHAEEEVATDVVPPTPTSPSPSSPVIPSLPPHHSPSSPQPQAAEGSSHLVQQIIKLKARVKKLETLNKVKSSKLRRLKKVGTSQRVESSDDVENVFNQRRISVDMETDEGNELTREEMKKEDEEIIKSINETHAQKAAKRRKLNEDDDVFVEATPLARKVPVVDYQVVVIDNKPKYKIIRAYDTYQFYISFTTLLKTFDREDLETLWKIVRDRFSTSKPTNFLDEYLLLTLKIMFEEPIGQNAIWRNQKIVHGLALVKRWKLLTSCGVHVIILSTVQLFLLVERRYPLSRFTLEQLVNVARLQVEEESEMSLELRRSKKNTKCVSAANEKAAKRRKLSEEAQEADDLRRHLEIVQDEDDDVFIEAIPLAQKVPVVEVVVIDNKPKYKIIRADDTHQFYISFTTLLKNFDKEDLEALWRIVKDRFSTKKLTNFLDEYLLLTLKTMFGGLDEHDAIWRNQKSVRGLALVKRWKLLTSCGVHVIILSTVQLFLFVERRYPLSRFTLEQLVNVARLQVEEESKMSLELLRFTRQQLLEYQQG
nr:hypothetical protein [Tanacetum cinerariifolium]